MSLRAVDLNLLTFCAALAATPAIAQQGGVAPPVTPVQAPAAATAEPPAAAEYILGPDDVIEVEIVGQADKARAKVYTDGTIQMNLVGKMSVAGKTPRTLGEEIAQALRTGGFYANPVVNVEVVSFASRYVTVLGSIGSPGLVPVNRAYRLSEILARVGGQQANAADYMTVTSENGEQKRYSIKDLAMGGAANDPFVQPGDKIFVPAAEEFYISGQVNGPGRLFMKTGMTVSQAIASAGGLTASGSDKKVEVTRDGKKMKLTGDAKVEPGDVLVVGERLF